MGQTAELIEITADNADRLTGVTAADVGGIAVRRRAGDDAEVYPDMAAAMTAITDPLDPRRPEIGECLPIGSGRRWLTVADEDEDEDE